MSETVFISSVMAGFEAVRQAAAEAVDSFGMRPVLAERAGARPQNPQQALLDEVARADVYLLLLGARYGVAGESGAAPTEEEFNEARRTRKPIIILRQKTDMEPDQQAFLDRVRGRWEQGLLYDSFTDKNDVGMAVVRALRNLRQLGDVREQGPIAQARALELAREASDTRSYTSGSLARLVLVPLVAGHVLDELALDDAALPDALSALARSSGLVAQTAGIEPRVTRAGIELTAASARRSEDTVGILVGSAGEITVDGPVGIADDTNFGSMRVGADELQRLIATASMFAASVWQQIDPRGRIQQLAVTVAIPGADMKVFGRAEGGTNSISMGGMGRMPQLVVAPDPPSVVRSADVESDDVHRRLVASVRRVFADAGAVEGRQ